MQRGLKHGYIMSKWGGRDPPIRQLPAVLAAPQGSPWTDTRNTLRASPAVLVAMHSNHPSSRGLGLVMSSEPEVCTLRGHSTRWGQPLHHGEQQEGEKKKTTQGARRVPVSTGQEVWVQGVAILLPPDLGCRGA